MQCIQLKINDTMKRHDARRWICSPHYWLFRSKDRIIVDQGQLQSGLHVRRGYCGTSLFELSRRQYTLLLQRPFPTYRNHLLISSFSTTSSSDTDIDSESTKSQPEQKERPLSLQLQRIQQQELRRQHRRKQLRSQQQQEPRTRNSNSNSNSTGNRSSPIQQTMQMKASPKQHEVAVTTSVPSTTSTLGNTEQEQSLDTTKKFVTPEEVNDMINQLHQDLTGLLRQLNTRNNVTVERKPLWDKSLFMPNMNDDDYQLMLQHHTSLFHRAIQLQNQLKQYVDQKYIRPGTLHRHEFVALVGQILQIYSHLHANVTYNTSEQYDPMTSKTILTQTLELIDWIRRPPFGLELSHKQCHAVITVAAKCEQWETASQIYIDHIDPDIAGYIPVPVNTIIARSFTMDGLYCIARAAKITNTLPVENVFDGVTKLMMVSPSDTESYVLAAGVALGHAGEWEMLRDFLKSSYNASRLGQPLVAATMHACVLCHKYQDAIDIFDDLVQGELASAAEWQWEGKKDALHPACRDLAIRSLGELKTIENAEEIKKRILELYNQARQDESKISTDAILAVVSAWDDDLETVMGILLPLFESGSLSRLVMGDDTQITSEQQQLPSQASQDIIHELASLLDLSMQICNSFQKFGLSLLCFRLFEITLMLSDLLSDQQMETITVLKGQTQYSNIVQTMLPILCIFKNSKEILNTSMVALCGVKLPQEAINLYDAVVANCADQIPREMHDVYEYAEFLRSSTDSASYQSWEPAHRHIHRLTASLAYVEDNESMLTTSESILLSSALATTIRECTVTANPEAGIVLGRWVESRPILGKTDEAPSLFSETKTDGIGLPVRLTDSLLSAAVEGFAQCGKMRFAESLIQTNLGNDRSPSNWLLSYHEAMKLLFSQGQNTDGLALFRTVIASAKNPDVFCTVAKSLIASGNWRQVLDLYRQAISSGCSSEELSLLTMESIAASGRIGQIDGQFPLLRSIISETSKSLGVSPAVWIETNYWKFKRVLGFSVARLIMGWDDYKLSRLDELDQAIETLEKRSIVGLTPKNAVLFSIVQAAANLEQYAVPYNATGLPKVPRDTDSWIKLVNKVLDEAKETRLFYEPNFIFEASLALRRVDRHVECLEIVSEALSRGLKLNKATLENAVLAGQAVGMEDATADMKMLLEGPS